MLSDVEARLTRLEDESQRLVDAYWSVWKEKNAKSSSGDYGRIGPRVMKTGGKVYIRWDKYRGQRKRGRVHADSISPTKKGFTKGCFRSARSWELEIILSYEKKFSELRKMIDVYWEARKLWIKGEECSEKYFSVADKEVDENDESFWEV